MCWRVQAVFFFFYGEWIRSFRDSLKGNLSSQSIFQSVLLLLYCMDQLEGSASGAAYFVVENRTDAKKALQQCILLIHLPFYQICISWPCNFMKKMLLYNLVPMTLVILQTFMYVFTLQCWASSEMQFVVVYLEIN